MRLQGKSLLLGALGMLVLLIGAALVVILTGSYNVAATERHTPLTAWALHTAFRNSVQSRAAEVTAPELVPAMVAAGAGEYKTMCAHCHGGVGEARAGWAEGLRPSPPALAGEADEWTASEVFWLVKHGAKMTGMPSFGGTHDDQTLWNIAAFVKALPGMTQQQYAAYSSTHGDPDGEGEAGHSHEEGAPAHQH